VLYATIHALIAAGLAVAPASSQHAAKPALKAATPAIGPVARTEFIQTMDAEFAQIDGDKNKVVTKAEIEAFQRATELAVARAKAHALFVRLDKDKNGQLSAAEFDGMGLALAPPNAAPVLQQNDLNGDGKITLVEYRTAKLANFDRMDTDKDGVVSIPEMRAAGLIK